MVTPVWGSLRWAGDRGVVVVGAGERRLFGRQRRANAAVPRDRRYTVKVTAAEAAELQARAELSGVTVSRLLFESAMVADVVTDADRKAVVAEFFAIRRLMAGAANNVNQVAKYANSEGVFPAEAAEVVAEYRAMVPRLSAALDRLAG